MNVRPAEPADAPAIRRVAEAAWWEAYPGVLDTDTVRVAVDDLYDVDFLREVLAEREDLLFLVAEDAGRADEREIDEGTEVDETGSEAGDGGVQGFLSAQQTWADEVEVHALYVHPDRWGEGTGTALLAAVEDSAREADVDRLRAGVLSGNSVGRAFFETRGFARVETLTAEVGDETVPEDAFEKEM